VANEQYLANSTRIDHYEIREVLGIGGFGIASKAGPRCNKLLQIDTPRHHPAGREP
jgi:hypothetical protein